MLHNSRKNVAKMTLRECCADLLLLQSLNKGIFQPVGVLCLQSFFLIGCHALLTKDSPALLLLPVGGEIGSALGAEERLHAGQCTSEFTCKNDSASVNSSAYNHRHNLKHGDVVFGLPQGTKLHLELIDRCASDAEISSHPSRMYSRSNAATFLVALTQSVRLN